MSTPKKKNRSVVCAGLLVADHLCAPISHLPAAGELVPTDKMVLNIGGCASNAAVVLAKLGITATVCGKVGNDFFGKFVVLKSKNSRYCITI